MSPCGISFLIAHSQRTTFLIAHSQRTTGNTLVLISLQLFPHNCGLNLKNSFELSFFHGNCDPHELGNRDVKKWPHLNFQPIVQHCFFMFKKEFNLVLLRTRSSSEVLMKQWIDNLVYFNLVRYASLTSTFSRICVESTCLCCFFGLCELRVLVTTSTCLHDH